MIMIVDLITVGLQSGWSVLISPAIPPTQYIEFEAQRVSVSMMLLQIVNRQQVCSHKAQLHQAMTKIGKQNKWGPPRAHRMN